DGMALAREYKPRVMIDLATLTGACAVALGNRIAGLFGNEPGLVEALREAGRASGETAWPMPLFEPYFEMLKSEVADFQSAGSRYGGAISAALFLKQFVGQTPWAHIDIAGPSRADKASPDTPAGATGFGAGLLLRYLRDLAAGGKRA
ncbi:MAG: leucyl aminopeptidase, partial [Proteobacteria bacterium]|nr:leucyl aminopeptidase [Pseudomonadota bacterium]